MAFSEELVRGSIEPIVLALLERAASYGYEILQQVNARTNGLLEWKEGTLYPALHRMEADGLLRAEWQAAPGAGARQRKYYHMTRRGRGALARHRRQWEQFSGAVNTLLLGGAA